MFIAFIFLAKEEFAVDWDLVITIVLFSALFPEGLRLVFFFVSDIIKIRFFFLQKKQDRIL